VPVAVRMLDNSIDVSRFPLPEQEHEAKATSDDLTESARRLSGPQIGSPARARV
jgi:hypothetical protein